MRIVQLLDGSAPISRSKKPRRRRCIELPSLARAHEETGSVFGGPVSVRHERRCCLRGLVILDMLQVRALDAVGLLQPWSGQCQNTTGQPVLTLTYFYLRGAEGWVPGAARDHSGAKCSSVTPATAFHSSHDSCHATLLSRLPPRSAEPYRSAEAAAAADGIMSTRIIPSRVPIPRGALWPRSPAIAALSRQPTWRAGGPCSSLGRGCATPVGRCRRACCFQSSRGARRSYVGALPGVIYDVAVSPRRRHDMFLQRVGSSNGNCKSVTRGAARRRGAGPGERDDSAADRRVMTRSSRWCCATLLEGPDKASVVIFWVLVMHASVDTGFAAPLNDAAGGGQRVKWGNPANPGFKGRGE